MTFNDKAVLFLATGCYAGKIPFAPGTFGTIAAVPLVWVLTWLHPALTAFYAVGFILLAVYIADRAESLLGQKDPGCIVIDEMAGFLVAMTVVPITMLSVAAGFLIFRFFDIIKLPPIRYFETRFNGGAGIVLDDIAAGLFTAVVLKILYFFELF
ncbi:MAG: phosphatidylglycerophosphatase A [Desulfobacteraceae bacterium]|nr:phosphatidylglycerophosphatase A [Desulfobacteraceae bacterium]